MNYHRSRQFFAIFLLLLLSMIFSGCGADPSSFGGSSSPAPSSSPAVTLSTSSLAFSNQPVGTSSPQKTITLTNSGDSTLSISAISASGDFSRAHNCGTSLAAGSNCNILVTFTPSAVGTRTGSISVTDDATNSPQTVSLSGSGVTSGSLTASPSSLSFGTVTIGQSSSKSVTVTNSSGSNATISSVSTSSGELAVSGISTPLTLSPNQSKTFTVTFSPSVSGSVSETVTLTVDSGASTLTIPAGGTGTPAVSHSVTLAWNPSSSSSVVGYLVHRGTVSGGPYAPLFSSPISGTIYTDQSVTGGATYFYVVTAVDATMAQSAYSNEATAAVPAP